MQFQAPDESDGSDAITVGAEIKVQAAEAFGADAGGMDIVFGTKPTGNNASLTNRTTLKSNGTLVQNSTLRCGTGTTSVESVADDFIIDPGVASVGMTIVSSTSGQGSVKFGDTDDTDVGGITYTHSDNTLIFTAGATNTANITASGVNITGQMYSTSVKVNDLGSGDVFSTGAGILTNTDPSDSRLKTNIENIDYGLSEILKLRSVKFNWLDGDKNSKKQFGFIAQEVKEIIPESVSEFDYDGDQRFGLEKNAIYVGLVKAIQEQQVIIEDLKSRIETLEG
jgi:hypothetical protein